MGHFLVVRPLPVSRDSGYPYYEIVGGVPHPNVGRVFRAITAATARDALDAYLQGRTEIDGELRVVDVESGGISRFVITVPPRPPIQVEEVTP